VVKSAHESSLSHRRGHDHDVHEDLRQFQVGGRPLQNGEIAGGRAVVGIAVDLRSPESVPEAKEEGMGATFCRS